MNGITKNYGSNYRVNSTLVSISNVFETNQVPERYYSIGKYAELAHCLEFSNGKWSIYYGEKGNKNRLVSYDDTDTAVKEFCLRVFPYEKDAKSAYKDYCNSKKKSTPNVGVRTKVGKNQRPSLTSLPVAFKKTTRNRRKIMVEKKDIG